MGELRLPRNPRTLYRDCRTPLPPGTGRLPGGGDCVLLPRLALLPALLALQLLPPPRLRHRAPPAACRALVFWCYISCCWTDLPAADACNAGPLDGWMPRLTQTA